MNKEKFLHIVQNHVFTESDDVLFFQKIAEQYSYSQIVHTLLAKHHSEIKSTEAKTSIQRAAIYATDRVVLRKIIESSPTQKITIKKEVIQSPPQKESENFTSISSGVSNIDQLRTDIFQQLDLLQESKKIFKAEKDNLSKNKIKEPSLDVVKTETKTSTKKKPAPRKKSKSETTKTTFSKRAKKEDVPLSQKEQVDLIEKFIKSPPKITKEKNKPASDENQQDLAEISPNIEEDFASENLAQILIKQGNKEKAIEIYKKLIWKFPQKKAYFATQIEGLKK